MTYKINSTPVLGSAGVAKTVNEFVDNNVTVNGNSYTWRFNTTSAATQSVLLNPTGTWTVDFPDMEQNLATGKVLSLTLIVDNNGTARSGSFTFTGLTASAILHWADGTPYPTASTGIDIYNLLMLNVDTGIVNPTGNRLKCFVSMSSWGA